MESASKCLQITRAVTISLLRRNREQIWQKVEDQRTDGEMSCITEHPGFESYYLDGWVLLFLLRDFVLSLKQFKCDSEQC